MQSAFLIAAGLLLVGFFLRVKLRFLQVLYIPASIVGGLLGLVTVQILIAIRPVAASPKLDEFLCWVTEDIVVRELKQWPGWLIAVVFAGLFLEKESRSFRDSIRLAGREGIVVWIIVLGQTALGLLATWLLIQPFFDVPNSFGMLIETGFAGGHGTAAAMGKVFNETNWNEGFDLGIFMATVGLVYSVVSGIVYVNLAVRKGWTRVGDVRIPILTGLESREQPEIAARGLVRSEVLDPMVFQTLILAAAFIVGLGLQWCVMSLVPDAAMFQYVKNIPIFIYTLIGGLIVRRGMDWLGIGDLIDAYSIRRLTSAAMEFLIVAAITSLNLRAVIDLIVPLSILLSLGFLWTGVCLLYIGRRLLPRGYWFELGIINYGMSTGTTATGLMLLRIVDKDLDSGAAEDYALAAPLSAPFVGGGLITLTLPLILVKVPIEFPVLILCAVIAILYVIGLRLAESRSDGE